ncbi:MAG: hypothetical protein HC905_30905 [Bacteroidales bacterium]|nr:hypothetical protein [Bacteroidales bacterium]
MIGAGAGFSSGFLTGTGNGLMQGQSFGDALGSGLKTGAISGASGALLGGFAGGIDAYRDGRNFWNGDPWEVTNNYQLPKGNLPIHQQSDPTVGCTQEVMESFVDYNYGIELNLDKSAGADFRVLSNDLGFEAFRNYNDVHRVGSQMLKGNPSAITYDNGGVFHTVGINRIQVMRTTRLFGSGYRYKNVIDVMNPLFDSFQTLSNSSFKTGVIRTLYF